MIDKYETKNRGKKKIVLLVKSQNSKFNELFRTANLIIGSFFFLCLIPRIPRAQHLCGLSHTHPRYDGGGINTFCCYIHVPYRLCHQLQQDLSTLRRLRWNTIVCSKHGSYRGGGCHSKKRAELFWPTFWWKGIPGERNDGTYEQHGFKIPLREISPKLIS